MTSEGLSMATATPVAPSSARSKGMSRYLIRAGLATRRNYRVLSTSFQPPRVTRGYACPPASSAVVSTGHDHRHQETARRDARARPRPDLQRALLRPPARLHGGPRPQDRVAP